MRDVMQSLRTGVPITLLVDLLCEGGPDSHEILRREQLAAEPPAWLAGLTRTTQSRPAPFARPSR